MPRGTQHDETGTLAIERGQLVLRRDDGGTWRLDAPRRAHALIGQRVRVIGTRADFDLLEVATVTAA